MPAAVAEPELEFATIGESYRSLKTTVLALGDDALRGDPARQVVSPKWFGERLFALDDAAAAARALDLITEEGEGTTTSPIDPDGDVAHYYRFFSFTGEPYRFDPAGVWPFPANQNPAAIPAGSEAGERLRRFQLTLGRLLRALQRVVDGEPGHLDTAMGLMFELKLDGQRLVATPHPTEPGRTVGPVFVAKYDRD